MSSSEEGDTVGIIRSLSHASGQLTENQMRKANRLAEVCKDVLDASLKNFVVEAEQRPCSRSCSSDGTPIVVSHSLCTELDCGRVVQAQR